MTKSSGSKMYSHSNIWLNVPWPFPPQSGAFDGHPQASGRPLAGILTTPLDSIGEDQLNLLASFLLHRV